MCERKWSENSPIFLVLFLLSHLCRLVFEEDVRVLGCALQVIGCGVRVIGYVVGLYRWCSGTRVFVHTDPAYREYYK